MNGPTSPRTNTAPPGFSASPASSTTGTAHCCAAVIHSTWASWSVGGARERGAQQVAGRLLVERGEQR